jgi:hypothetical protein
MSNDNSGFRVQGSGNKPTTSQFSWLNPKLVIRETCGHGKGVFTHEWIAAGEYLLVSGGYIVPVDCEEGDFGGQVTENLVMTTKMAGGDDSEQFNHSCNPNSGISGMYTRPG